jgi:hypothetical protein
MEIKEKAIHNTEWTITRYENDEDFKNNKPYNKSFIYGNCLLNEGIIGILALIAGTTGPLTTYYDNAHAYIGVGESATAAGPTQAGLLGSTILYRSMAATYPLRSNQTITWRAVFTGSDANWLWTEFCINNASSNAGSFNLNRVVSGQGTKTNGQTWTVDVAITLT